jgi:Na+/proline symporter
MAFVNIDIIIVLVYLTFTLCVGLTYARKSQNIEDFVSGGGYFNTKALTISTAATCFSSHLFVLGIIGGYIDGFANFVITSTTAIGLLITAYFFAPKMVEFLGDFSVAHSMRKLFGRQVGIITAILGLFVCICFIAIQFKILASVFTYFEKIHVEFTLFLCTLVVVLYSIFGGIRAVIVTDILQFITFIIIVPTISIMILWEVLEHTMIHHAISVMYNHGFNMHSLSWNHYASMFFCFLIPASHPVFFQRIIISRDIKQSKNMLSASAFIYLFYTFTAVLIGVMFFTHKNGIEHHQTISFDFPFMLKILSYPGMMGIILVALISVALSTADSSLHSFATMFTRDVCKELKLINFSGKKELLFSRIVTCIVAAVAAVAGLYYEHMVKLLIIAADFYVPIISVPLTLGIIGFRSTPFSVLIGMFAGFVSVAIWKGYGYYHSIKMPLDSLVPGSLMNFICYISSHYIFKQSGGWGGFKSSDFSTVEVVTDDQK